MHTVHMKLLLVSVTLNCFCVSADVWDFIFGPRLKPYSSRLLENENNTEHNYVKELTDKYGYPLQNHHVLNSQGYLLTLHRLPYGRKTNSTKRPRPVVLLHLGLLGSPECFLFRGPQHDLPYLLADSGYDMWILSNRGSSYSRRHLKYNPDSDKNYWDYSFHEQAIYDLSAVIDYILGRTKQKDLFLVGYSIGCSVGYILCSLKPEYNSKIKHFINFAPATEAIHRLTPAHNILFSMVPGLVDTLNRQNISEIFPRRETSTDLLTNTCRNGSRLQPICVAMIFLFVGVDYQQFNPDIFPQIFRYFPDGASLRTIDHYIQMTRSGTFGQYNYGQEMNKIMYGSEEPPRYNLTDVTVPVSIYYGAGDFLVTSKDCEHLSKRLPNVVGLYKVPFQDFNHMDFMWAKDVRRLLYEPVVNLLNKHK